MRRLNRPVVAVVAVGVLAAIVRLATVDDPRELVFDELYYAKAGCVQVTELPPRSCLVDSDDERYWLDNEWDTGSWVHPPLGKLTIGLGIEWFSMSSFGWRITSVLAGVGVAICTAIMAQLLLQRPIWTFVAGLLIAVDGLNVVHSRVALLDIHLAFWIALGFLFMLVDRRWIDRRTPEAPEADVAPEGSDTAPRTPIAVPSPLLRPWRLAAGVAFGAATAVKWSGAMAIVAAIVLTYVWETTRRMREGRGRGRAVVRTLGIETLGVALAFAVVPLVVYTLTWIPWFVHFEPSWRAFLEQHADMWTYHRELRATALDTASDAVTPTHAYYSRAWTWIPMLRPVNYFVEDLGPDIRQILAIGNPVLFWGTMWTIPYCAWAWRRTRDWKPGFVVVAFAGLYLPWFLVSRPQFFFYALPLTPFMALAAAYTLRDLAAAHLVIRDHETDEVATDPDTGGPAVSARRPYLPFVVGYVAAAVALFWWFWPVLTAGRLSDTMWRARVWFPGWT